MKKLYYLLRHYFFLNKLSFSIPGLIKPFILCYHQIDEAEFEAQLTELSKKFQIVSLAEFLNKRNNKEFGNYCAITLDDCLVEDVEKASRVCKKLNAPITYFLPVRFSKNNETLPSMWLQKLIQQRNEIVLNGEKYTLTPSNYNKVKSLLFSKFNPAELRIEDYHNKMVDLYKENNITEADIIKPAYKVLGEEGVKKYCADNLFNFQSHTYNHQSLGLCTKEEIIEEFSKSKEELEVITQREIFAICYPYGSGEVIGDKVFDIAADYYKCGLTLIPGVCDKNADVFRLPRIGIYPGDNLIAFWGKIYHYMQMAYIRK